MKMLMLGMAACGAMTLCAKPNASEYVQRGLVAHWDATDNVGYGQHDGSSSTWKDLTGNGFDWTLDMDKVTWGGDALAFNGTGDGTSVAPGTMTKTCSDFYGRIKTIEIVMVASKIQDSIVFSPGFADRTAGLAILKDAAAIAPYCAAGSDGYSSLGCAIAAGSTNVYRFVYDISKSKPKGLLSIVKDGADTAVQTYASWLGQVTTPSLGARIAKWTKPFVGNIHALRIYDTELLPSEAMLNDALDRVRIFGASPSSVKLPEGYSFDEDGNLVRPARKAHEAWRNPFDDVKVWYKGAAGNEVGTADSGGADGWSDWSICGLRSQTRAGIYDGCRGRYYWWGDRIAYRNENVHLPYANLDLGASPCFVFPASRYETNDWAEVTIGGEVVSRPVIKYRPAHLQFPTWLPDWPSGAVCSNWTCVLRFRPDSAINPVSGNANVMTLFRAGNVYQGGDKPSGINISLNTPTTLSDRFNLRFFVGSEQVNFSKNLIQNGNWVDLGVIVDGANLTMHLVYEDGAEGAKTNVVYTYARTFAANEPKPAIGASSRTFRLGSCGTTGTWYQFTNGVNASSLQADFHGAFHQVAFWDRSLSIDEVKEAMGGASLMSVGMQGNEGNCEFTAKKTSVRAERDGEDLNPVLTSANPTATIAFNCPAAMAGLPQFLRVACAATSSEGTVEATLNGTALASLAVVSGAVSSAYVAQGLIVAGENVLALTRTAGDKVVLDAVTLGAGSFLYGVDAYNKGISTFGYDKSSADSYGLNPSCGNNKFHIRGVGDEKAYDCFLRIPEDLDGCLRGTFSFRVQNTSGALMDASVKVNGEVLQALQVKGGNRYEVYVPADALTSGENVISLVAGKGGSNWFNMDCLKFVARPHRVGTAILVR